MQISLLYSKKVDGQAFKSAEVQMSAGEFSHGPDFSTKILFLRLALERIQWVPAFSNFFAPLTLDILLLQPKVENIWFLLQSAPVSEVLPSSIEVIISPKMPTRNFKDFCPTL